MSFVYLFFFSKYIYKLHISKYSIPDNTTFEFRVMSIQKLAFYTYS